MREIETHAERLEDDFEKVVMKTWIVVSTPLSQVGRHMRNLRQILKVRR